METVEHLRREAALRPPRYWGSCRGCSGLAWFPERRTPERLSMRLVSWFRGVHPLGFETLLPGSFNRGAQNRAAGSTGSGNVQPFALCPAWPAAASGLFHPQRHCQDGRCDSLPPPRGRPLQEAPAPPGISGGLRDLRSPIHWRPSGFCPRLCGCGRPRSGEADGPWPAGHAGSAASRVPPHHFWAER